MDYSIRNFWGPRFASIKAQQATAHLEGWWPATSHASSFVEANLSLRGDFNDLSQSVWMIAAPGAVGKSTLAREICAATNAVYLDLSAAATVAGNYLVGGLVKAGLWDAWQGGASTLLIDALDEARLRVTQSSFEDFLADVATVAGTRGIPVILLGRVGIVEEAWAILNEKSSINPPIFDIQLFNPDRSKEFVLTALNRLANATDVASGQRAYPHLVGALSNFASVYSDAVQFLVDHLADATSADGRQFAGYAPVLEAVATVIASETNPAKISDAMKSILQGQVLGRVTSEVMIRESGKLAVQMAASVPGIDTTGLYGPKEQLARLASFVLKAGNPEIPPSLPQHAISAYEQAVQSLLPQHPFLDSREPKASSAVFGASILAAALISDDSDIARAAERYIAGGSNTPNPFLLEFYIEAVGDKPEISASHIGLLFESLEAIAGVGDVARLSAEGDDSLDVEMVLVQRDGGEERYEFKTASGGTLRFGRRVGGVSIDTEQTDVEFGDGGQLELIAPIAVRARSLVLNCNELVVKPDSTPDAIDHMVFLEATDALTDVNLRAPLVRAGAKLQVAWPGSKIYPWTPFSSDSSEDPDPRMADAQRALRRLCISFRSHSKGRLARYRGKVEHFRMTKGSLGIALRQRLIDDKVLSLEGPMYFLEPDLLGKTVGISFQDLKLKNYPSQSRAYLQVILDGLND
ncbi:hypothetical protein [Burkholderia thailandensis]|uniref:hypothetical protein n=1 Tax=Burkholderia thailandensis TaxID=57975 RepID=UPI0003ECA885|nr:hypothetical protein [Burkholderia thailandensis]AHI66156.1 hypothetical protein BTL_685 [Burkholderia thailandensis H0587]